MAHERLDELMREGWLGRHRGEYYLRWESRPKVELTSEELCLHLVAAKAWAPILDSSPVALVNNRDSVFETYALDEAIWHLRTLIKQVVPRMREIQVESRTALRTALALLPAPDWDLVRPLMGAGRIGREEALDLVEELLALETEVRGSPARIHSSRYALAINAAARRLGDVAADDHECERILRLATEWYGRARDAAGENAPQLLKLLSEHARFLRVWEAVSGCSPQAALAAIEGEIEQRIAAWKKTSRRSDSEREVPLAMEWLKMRMADGRPEDVRSLDARLAAELWQDRWREPWLMLLGLMVAPRFTTAQFAGVFNLLGDSPAACRVAARKLGRAFRLSTYKKTERDAITRVMGNLLNWLFSVPDPLIGYKADAAIDLISEWISESHNCFDVAQVIPSYAFTELIVRGRPDERFARLAEIVFRDSWGCWAYLSRIPRDLSFESRRAITIHLANCAPEPRFEGGLEIGDAPSRKRGSESRAENETEVFWPESIPPRYVKSRRLTLDLLDALRVPVVDSRLNEARARLVRSLAAVYPPGRIVAGKLVSPLSDARRRHTGQHSVESTPPAWAGPVDAP
jgi:hypothetical protein